MTLGEWIGCTAVLIWLLGIGVLAQETPKVIEENDFTQMLMVLFPGKIAAVMALVIVACPLAIIGFIVMKATKERG